MNRHDSPAQVTINSLTKMREALKNLEKREQFLDTKAKTQLDEAMAKNKAGDKKGAVAAMTRKKLYDAEGECCLALY
jgi:charged multivesicular body protein 4